MSRKVVHLSLKLIFKEEIIITAVRSLADTKGVYIPFVGGIYFIFNILNTNRVQYITELILYRHIDINSDY